MPQTKTAAPALQHRNGQTKNFITCILPHISPICKAFANFTLTACGLGALCAVAALAQGGGAASLVGWAPACWWLGRHHAAGGGDMRGIVIDPGAKPELYRLPDTLQELQRFMGGYAQRCPISNRFAALFYLPQAGQSLPTRHYKGRWFYGRLCLVGWRNARMTDLPMPLAEELLQKFTPVEVTP